MKLISFLIFIIIALSVYFSMHYYVYHRLVIDLNLSGRPVLYLKIFLLVMGLSFFAAEFLSRAYTVKSLIYTGSVWLGILSISVSFFLLKDILNIFLSHHNTLLTTICLFLIALSTGFSLWNASQKPVEKSFKLSLKNMPSSLSGLSLVHLSDIHIGPSTSLKQIQDMVSQVNSMAPDLILITGDVMDIHVCKMDRFCEALKGLKARYGIYAVPGNHEFYNGFNHFLELGKSTGIRILNNESVRIAGLLDVAGINDPAGKQYPGLSPDLVKALRNCDKTRPVILLSHQPLHFQEAVKNGVSLQLSGHIHNGQLPPLYPLVYLLFKYPYGLYQFKDAYIYTTSGTGIWGPPMRLFSRCEIVKFILQ
ncbi:MAG: metallophosphoesterase [bacterium]|nr:metallophosphoesterase [bacterium]